MNLKKIVGIAVLSAFSIGTVQARDFSFADVYAQDTPTVMTARKIGDLISQKSSGKYAVKVFGNGALGSEKETLEQVKIGALDMVRANTSSFHNTIPETVLPSLPFLFRDISHFRKAMAGPAGNKIMASFEKSGFVALALWETGARSISAKKPLRTPADIKGLKLPAETSALWTSLAQALGINPTVINAAEVYPALKSGMIDAAENNYFSYETHKHYEVAPIYSETQHMISPEVLLFSKKIWDTLTPDEQKTIRDAAREASPYYVDLLTKKEAAAKEVAKKGGATFIDDVNKPEFVTAAKPVWDKFSPTPELKALVQSIVNTK
ncbi:MAG: TRAP transporter substrate-binding protein [Betaproteobacteria bacterium]